MICSEIKYQPEKGKCYVGSPSIVRLPDGSILTVHDYFGPGAPHTPDGMEGLSSVYSSEDNGRTWTNITHVMNAYWSTLFIHNNSVYLLGCFQEYGSIVIRRSDDGGFSWTDPKDSKSGLLFKAASGRENPNYHCAPVPVTFHNGRIYRAFEECEDAKWPSGFKSFVISADENADLLDASSWTMSNKIKFNPEWLPPAEYEDKNYSGWLEGNIVVKPDGKICNILRLQSPIKVWHGHEPSSKDASFNMARYKECAQVNKAAIVSVSDDGTLQSFVPHDGLIDFPGGGTGKFTIRRDPARGIYLSLVNANADPDQPCSRNVLSLVISEDLFHWKLVKKLIEDDSGLEWNNSCTLTGFQYADWQFDGDDLIYIVRLGHRGSRNFHDSNRITFHRLEKFRRCYNACGITEPGGSYEKDAVYTH